MTGFVDKIVKVSPVNFDNKISNNEDYKKNNS